jgi:hypothetical protein
MCDTSTRMRGRKAIRSNARRFRPEGRFRLGTAHQIVPGPLVHAATCFLDDFFVADKLATHLLASSVPS